MQDLLSPEHPQSIVHQTCFAELALRGIPERVVSRSRFELFQRVKEGPWIGRMLSQRLAGPGGKRSIVLVIWAMKAKVKAKLSPGHELIQKRLR